MGDLGRAGVSRCSGHSGSLGEKQASFLFIFYLLNQDPFCASRTYYERLIPTTPSPPKEENETAENLAVFDVDDLNSSDFKKSRSFSVDF